MNQIFSLTPGTSHLGSHRRALAFVALMASTSLMLGGCAATSSPEPATTTATATKPTMADALTMTNGWVKAVDTDMSGAFGLLENSSNSDIVVVSASSPAANLVELHEVIAADGSMKEIAGGLVVKAGGNHELAPGADHVMLMKLTGPLRPGDTVELTLTLDDGSTSSISLPVKDYAGANENYLPEPKHS